MNRRLPEGGYPGFAEIQEIIGRHDVKFNNLEITIHNQEGYPAVVSGGTWAMAEPEILDDLKKYGFNLYNTANNHSGDYGSGGILATCNYLRERDMLYAGTGATLREAAAVMACTAVDFLTNPQLVAQAKENWLDRLGGETYPNPLPADCKPEIW